MTKELKELVGFGLSVGELIAGLADGFGFDDVKKAIDAAKLAAPAFKDAHKALAEYVGMTDTEAAELEAYVFTEFDIADDKIEAAIEGALKLAIELRSLVALLVPKA